VCDARGVLTKRTRGPAGALTPDFVPCRRVCDIVGEQPGKNLDKSCADALPPKLAHNCRERLAEDMGEVCTTPRCFALFAAKCPRAVTRLMRHAATPSCSPRVSRPFVTMYGVHARMYTHLLPCTQQICGAGQQVPEFRHGASDWHESWRDFAGGHAQEGAAAQEGGPTG